MPFSDPEKQRAWKRADYAANKDRYCSEKRERYAKNPGPFLEASNRSRQKHLEKRRAGDCAQGKTYYRNNREKVLKRTLENERARYKTDWAYAEARRIRCRTRDAFKRAGVCKPTSTLRLVGCTAGKLRDHIASQFAGGMSWENRHLWHVDHIYPLCAANLADPIEASVVCNWRNLRPSWKTDNISKGGKVFEDSLVLFAKIKNELYPDKERSDRDSEV
jgi:hypothetical protein